MATSSLKEIIWQVVAAVPPGKVATYGQVARLAGYPNHARYVGTTLKHLPPTTTLPWYRVINGKGEIAFPEGSPGYKRQKSHLLEEGVAVIGKKVSLGTFQWDA